MQPGATLLAVPVRVCPSAAQSLRVLCGGMSCVQSASRYVDSSVRSRLLMIPFFDMVSTYIDPYTQPLVAAAWQTCVETRLCVYACVCIADEP